MSGSNADPRAGNLVRALVGAVALLLAAACSREAAPTVSPRRGNPAALRVSQRNEPADLDPALASMPDEFFIDRALCEGLVAPSPDGRGVVPAAAAWWDIAPDGLRYTFHLRPGARWSNGDPVTADQFVASYKRILEPATPAPKAALFYPILNARAYKTGALVDFSRVGLRAADPLTLVVTLGAPCPDFLLYAASGPWLPVDPRVVAAEGRDWTRPGRFVGNGPFTLVEWTPHQRIVVRRRRDYWDAAAIRVPTIEFVAMDDGDSEERSFRAGQLDVTMAVPPSLIAAYSQEKPAMLRIAPLIETRYLAFNCARAPLNDARVRRALSLALDRRQLVDRVLLGHQIPTRAFLPPPLSRAPGPTPSQDVARARRELAAAGYPGGRGFPVLELSSWTNRSLLEAIQEQWRRVLGIGVEITVRDAKEHVAALRDGRYDIGFITLIPDVADPVAALSDLLPGAPGNYAHWTDAAFATDVHRASAATTARMRDESVADAERRLVETCPVAPLYVNTHVTLVRPEVAGWREDGLWNRFYKGVWLR